ncbi:unnamed protein product [Danaus chrysippus]|uniref:(African queen) hypothetical protein n=1 Tax=Danaus chrysippus TaxID=151541 RepID=A0A8J2W115_9NEOP|nr:unnamed protein product [Danaus chrysippus]
MRRKGGSNFVKVQRSERTCGGGSEGVSDRQLAAGCTPRWRWLNAPQRSLTCISLTSPAPAPPAAHPEPHTSKSSPHPIRSTLPQIPSIQYPLQSLHLIII